MHHRHHARARVSVLLLFNITIVEEKVFLLKIVRDACNKFTLLRICFLSLFLLPSLSSLLFIIPKIFGYCRYQRGSLTAKQNAPTIKKKLLYLNMWKKLKGD